MNKYVILGELYLQGKTEVHLICTCLSSLRATTQNDRSFMEVIKLNLMNRVNSQKVICPCPCHEGTEKEKRYRSTYS